MGKIAAHQAFADSLKKVRTTLFLRFLLIFAAISCSLPTFSATFQNIEAQLRQPLSDLEKDFLRQNKTLKVQSESNYPPFNYVVNGQPSGFSIDYIEMLAKKLDMDVQFAKDKSWREYLKMLESKELDAMVNIMENDERRQFADFTTDYAQTFIMAITRHEDKDIVTDKSKLSGKRVVTVRGYAGFSIISEILPDAVFVKADDSLDALTQVASNKADVFFANGVMTNYYIKKYFMTGLTMQPVPRELSFPRQHLRIATHKDNTVLLGLLQKALNSVDEQEMIALRQKWFGTGTLAFDDGVKLSNSQKIWLLRNRDISISLPSIGLPLGENSKTIYHGMFADFIRHFDNVLGTNWLLNHKSEIASPDLTIANTFDRTLLPEYNFSQPILSMPVVALTADPNRKFVGDLDELSQTNTGIVKNAGYIDEIAANYPNLALKPFDTMEAAIAAVNTGKVDILLCPLAHCTYVINEMGANNIRVIGQTNYFANYSFAVKKDLPQLLNIVENTLASMGPERRNGIFRLWNTNQEVLVKTDYSKVKYLVGSILLIFALIVLWNINIAKYAKNVEQAHEELKQTQSKLVQAEKMASLGTLTAGVAHEINNPTNFVHVGVQNLEVDLEKVQKYIFELAGEDADDEILKDIEGKFNPLFDHLHTIVDGTARIKSIVQDLRAFSRLDKVENQQADVRQCLQSTINLVRTKYIEVADIITEFGEVQQLNCHPAQLNQVFMNIIVNACHAIMAKQRNSVEEMRGLVTIGCRQKDNDIIVSVKDNGCGMDEATKSRLFEPFYTTKAVGEGTGLGMAISFSIINEHGGHMEVFSKEGKGSELKIYLPLGDS